MSSHETYELIRKECEANPSLKVATVCRQHGASYGGYRYWYARWQKKNGNGSIFEAKPVPTKPVSANLVSVTFHIKLEELSSAMVQGRDKIEVSIADLIEKMPAEEAKRLIFYGLMGRKAT